MEVVGLNQGIFASDMAYYHALKQNPQHDQQDMEDEGAGAVIWDDDSWAQNGVFAAGDDSFVDQLLNLEFEDGFFPVEDQGWEENDRKDAALHPPSSQPSLSAAPTTTTVDDLTSVLSVPAEEADLEWVSQFMEDSNIPQYTYPTEPLHSTKPTPPPVKLQGQVTPLNCLPSAPLPLSKSRRSKRSRLSSTSSNIYARVWPYPTSPTTHFPTSSSSSASTASPPSSPSTPLAFDSAFPPHPSLNPTKKQKKSSGATTSSGDSGSSGSVRRCSHCGVQKTPQWRAGPMGAKTLCNACGVRFKSGRLFPEYRPACSPTFSSELHSNSHRKVLEMRKKKDGEVDGSGVPDSGIAPAVSV